MVLKNDNVNEQNKKVEETIEYLKFVIPLNSLVEFTVTLFGTRNINCRVIDFVGVNEDDIYVYKCLTLLDDKVTTIYLNLSFDKNKKNYMSFTKNPKDKKFELQKYEVFQRKDKNVIRLLVIGGPSGSGKSYLENQLVTEEPNLYNKLTQVTTREKRDEEDPYIFIDQKQYDKLNNYLIGRIKPTSKFGTSYGTLPLYDKDKINTIILSEEGYTDLLETVKTNSNLIVMTVFTNPRNVELTERINRDENFIKEEMRLSRLFMFDCYRHLDRSDENNRKISRILHESFVSSDYRLTN